jgi:hypothetical protein
MTDGEEWGQGATPADGESALARPPVPPARDCSAE